MLNCPFCGSSINEPELVYVHPQMYWGGTVIPIKHRAAELLSILLDSFGHKVPFDEIHRKLYGIHEDGGPTDNNIRVHVCLIRKVFREHEMPFQISTVRDSMEHRHMGIRAKVGGYILHSYTGTSNGSHREGVRGSSSHPEGTG